MKYLSVCAGIEAATVAWHDLGWQAAAYSEIEKFPCEVLKHHYPNVMNVGDMTKFEEWQIESIDLLVGGTPCQSFSVAGLRKGLDDPRGNLMLTYGAIAKRFRPKWLVWENVPGVLSSNGGRDFGTFLGMLGELGYGFAYRVLDAQYFGVAQRRRRVFVVGCLGDWRRAAAVLFERNSLCGNPAPSRKTGKNIADGVGKCLTARGAGGGNCDPETANMIPAAMTYEWHNQDSRITPSEVASTLSCNAGGREGNLVQPIPIDTMNHIGRGDSHSFGGFEPGAPSYTLTKGHSHAVAQPIPIQEAAGRSETSVSDTKYSLGVGDCGDPMFCLTKVGTEKHGVAHPIGFDEELNARQNVMGTLLRGPEGGRKDGIMQTDMAVRRLTPVECERLQGFPDNYTNIKSNCPDGPRYKALGNSMAVPVMRWIGQRIQFVEGL